MFDTDISTGPRLRRALTLWDLTSYGIVIISPVGAMAFFGVLSQGGHGHAPTTILIATIPMLLTAISYGRMARAYPSAGSAFTYVGREISPALGYLTGWGMVMDYLVGPLINIIWCAQQGHIFVPAIPYWVWAVLFSTLLTVLTVQGVKISARVNAMLAAAMGVVIVVFLVAATLYVRHHPHAGASFFTRPFYDPQTWTWKGIFGGTSLAMLTYLGFDGISTLSEEAKDPRRHILPATVLACLVIGAVSVLEVYAAQLVWPTSERYPDQDTAFTFIAQRAWAPLFGVVGVTLIVAYSGAGMSAQMGAARLLYGMGRSGALPRAFFAAIDPKRHVPRNNVLLVGAFVVVAAIVLPLIAGRATGYELAANLLNFGALVAFMGVNAAAFVHYYLRSPRKRLYNGIGPIVGFIVCLLLWWNLSTQALVLGMVWMLLGAAYGAWRTRCFRTTLISFEPDKETAPCNVDQMHLRATLPGNGSLDM
jgi:putrescine importer